MRHVLRRDVVLVADRRILTNQVFLYKMYLLLAALIYNFTIHRKVATIMNPPPAVSRLAASLSRVL
jgi:hypothetical protein